MNVRPCNAATALILLLACSTGLQGQSFEELRSKAQSGFGSYREKSIQQMDDFRARADAAYSEVLRKSWKRVSGGVLLENPLRQTPDITPVSAPSGSAPASFSIPPKKKIEAASCAGAVSLEIPEDRGSAVESRRVSFLLYGRRFSAGLPAGQAPRLVNCGEDAVADAWKVLSSGAYDSQASTGAVPSATGGSCASPKPLLLRFTDRPTATKPSSSRPGYCPDPASG